MVKHYADGDAPKCQDGWCKSPPPEPKKVFPDLEVLPRPEPDPATKDDHDAWLLEYDQWRALRCPCGRGYFCREHGSWISKDDIISGLAASADEQKKGSCPSYHYGDYGPIKSYIGERDAFSH